MNQAMLDLIRLLILPKANIDGNCPALDILSRGKKSAQKRVNPEVEFFLFFCDYAEQWQLNIYYRIIIMDSSALSLVDANLLS